MQWKIVSCKIQLHFQSGFQNVILDQLRNSINGVSKPENPYGKEAKNTIFNRSIPVWCSTTFQKQISHSMTWTFINVQKSIQHYNNVHKNST
jgi:hypothetical protein